ncbi:hypothetical protein [Alloyangia pacifica]|uniref:Uncharacterized protein n=1 Tax=Alloyangia pacifica TaxID=311180 RepID=A0A1I6PFX2_9RHOB|nr:hypothetical protein [Alloyangia pacifica]SDG26846.1 hypothetical protein SAMN04488245_102209 [Alloyangia pacifica]SFS39102.1 hypothetical protein SAMN04488050_101510 [Alloyangia pacifica]
MNWQSITRNWGLTAERLAQRFPQLEAESLRRQRPDRGAVAQEIADRHDLTLLEAERELDDWLFAQSAAQQLDRLAG